ncbi:MAG: 4-oxalomesaconate tautomerase, partial [Pseudomonadota bacterium]
MATCYFMPWSCDPSLAVTIAPSRATCPLCPGKVAAGQPEAQASPLDVKIEHPRGILHVRMEYSRAGEAFELKAAE